MVNEQQICGSYVTEYNTNPSTNTNWWRDLQENRSAAGYTQVVIKQFNKYSNNILANNVGAGMFWRRRCDLNRMRQRMANTNVLLNTEPDHLYTSVSANPLSGNIYLDVFSGFPSYLIDQSTAVFTIKITYTVEFCDLLFIGQSS